MALLLEYQWPGNVRELENVIQGAIILSDDDTIQPKDLPQTMQHPDLLGLGDSLPGASFEEQMRDYKNQAGARGPGGVPRKQDAGGPQPPDLQDLSASPHQGPGRRRRSVVDFRGH